MSRLIRCENGHFYDANKWRYCPNCNNNFRMNQKPESDIGDIDTIRLGAGESLPGKRPVPGIYNQAAAGGSDDVTIPITPGRNNKLIKDNEIEKEKEEKPARDQNGNVIWNEEEGEKTISIFPAARKMVCGWLVCVAGQNKGKDYRIVEGRNLLGRDSDMDIAIKEDKMISRNHHCSIVYDKRKNQTWVAVGQGSLTYYNGELLKGQKELKTGDTIEIGKTRLMFVGFCEGERSWDQLG